MSNFTIKCMYLPRVPIYCHYSIIWDIFFLMHKNLYTYSNNHSLFAHTLQVNNFKNSNIIFSTHFAKQRGDRNTVDEMALQVNGILAMSKQTYRMSYMEERLIAQVSTPLQTDTDRKWMVTLQEWAAKMLKMPSARKNKVFKARDWQL